MRTDTEEPTIVESKLVFPLEKASEDFDGLLRRAVRALGTYAGKAFVPEGKRDKAFMEGAANGLDQISLVHPKFSDAAGYENSWLSVTVDSYAPRPIGAVFLSIHMGRPGDQLDLEWNVGLEVMPRLVVELDPTLAFMTAKLVDVERKVFPPEEPIAGLPLPRKFTPWTYFAAEGVSEQLRAKLASLPAAVSARSGQGWIVQAVDSVRVPAPRRFIDALRQLSSERIEYLEPILSAEQ